MGTASCPATQANWDYPDEHEGLWLSVCSCGADASSAFDDEKFAVEWNACGISSHALAVKAELLGEIPE